MTTTVAVVPLRGGATGKSRLAGVLGPADRSALVVLVARHVVATLAAAEGVAEVLVVTTDPVSARASLATPARGAPVRVVPQPADRAGLDAAVDVGREAAAGRASRCAAPRLLVVHADLPALTGQDVAALLGVAGPLTLATDRAGTGTNALLLRSAADRFTFRFGVGSLAAHREEAARRGWDPLVVRRPGLSVDLDTRADWTALPADVRRRLAADVPALDALDALDAPDAPGRAPRPSSGRSAPRRGAAAGLGRPAP